MAPSLSSVTDPPLRRPAAALVAAVTAVVVSDVLLSTAFEGLHEGSGGLPAWLPQLGSVGETAVFYRRSRTSASGLDPEGEVHQKILTNYVDNILGTVRNPQRRITDRNPTLTAEVWKCDISQHPAVMAGETGVVGSWWSDRLPRR